MSSSMWLRWATGCYDISSLRNGVGYCMQTTCRAITSVLHNEPQIIRDVASEVEVIREAGIPALSTGAFITSSHEHRLTVC